MPISCGDGHVTTSCGKKHLDTSRRQSKQLNKVARERLVRVSGAASSSRCRSEARRLSEYHDGSLPLHWQSTVATCSRKAGLPVAATCKSHNERESGLQPLASGWTEAKSGQRTPTDCSDDRHTAEAALHIHPEPFSAQLAINANR